MEVLVEVCGQFASLFTAMIRQYWDIWEVGGSNGELLEATHSLGAEAWLFDVGSWASPFLYVAILPAQCQLAPRQVEPCCELTR